MAYTFWTEVKRRVIKWEKRFRKDAAAGTMENIETLTGVDYRKCSGRKKAAFVKKAFERQIKFVKYMAVCYMTGKMDVQGLRKLDRMLELLDMDVSLKKDKKAPVTVVFYMDDGFYLFLAADYLDDIDHADAYAAITYSGLGVNRKGRDCWTAAVAKEVEKQINFDLRYDYKNVKVFMQRVSLAREFLQFRCEVLDEDLGTDKYVKRHKCMELFGVG
jgi:hypothetical protein